MNKQHPKKERTFVILKPDAIQRSLVGEIVGRIERTGLKIVYMKMTVIGKDQEQKLWDHYNKDETWFAEKGAIVVSTYKKAGLPIKKDAVEYGKDIVRQLISFMTAGPVVILVIEGNRAVGIVQKLVGSTEPLSSDVGTIRGDLTLDSYGIANIDERAVRNLAHCSDSPEEAEREMEVWLTQDEIITYRHINEAMLYDVNLDGILE